MWIGLVLFIFLAAAFPFIKDIDLDRENAVLDEIDAIELASDRILEAHYTPLSIQDRIAVHEDYLEKLTRVQNKISNTTLAKLLVDFNNPIKEIQNTILELRQNHPDDSENVISFQTREEHSIFSDREFTKETLLNFASVIDSALPGNEGNAVFILNCEYGYVSLAIIPYENPENFEKTDLQQFAGLLSDGVFNGDPVFINIDIQH